MAIIGASGRWKTALVKLLLWLLKPAEGRTCIGGHDPHTLGARNVRTIVGAVMLDDQLFAGGIADNIGFFDPEFDLERIEQAARLAAVHDDIAAVSMGYHGLMGDMGSSLSSGQKQRIIRARAVSAAKTAVPGRGDQPPGRGQRAAGQCGDPAPGCHPRDRRASPGNHRQRRSCAGDGAGPDRAGVAPRLRRAPRWWSPKKRYSLSRRTRAGK